MLRIDPSGTAGLVRELSQQVRGRFRHVGELVKKKLVDEDALGLDEALSEGAVQVGHLDGNGVWVRERVFVGNSERRVWEFLSNEQKLVSFNSWLETQVQHQVLAVDAMGRPWTEKLVAQAFGRGVSRAYVDATGAKLRGGVPGFFAGSKSEFLRQAFSDPAGLGAVKFLSTRAFEELRGLSRVAATQLNRILANGLVQGKGARAIAKEMAAKVDGLAKQRAVLIARTELVAAQAEGQLDGYEALGVTGVGVFAEWTTAGDERVCASCGVLEGTTFTLEQARGMLPRHPQCRCSWVPAAEVARRTAQKAALARSLRAETGSKSKRAPGRRSAWSGKRLLKQLQKRGVVDNAIRKVGVAKWRLYSLKKGKGAAKNLGTFDSRAAAERHEAEVEWFKSHPTTNDFDPSEKRDATGKWTTGGGGLLSGLSPELVKRVHDLKAQGKTLKQIAADVGLKWPSQVMWYLKKPRPGGDTPVVPPVVPKPVEPALPTGMIVKKGPNHEFDGVHLVYYMGKEVPISYDKQTGAWWRHDVKSDPNNYYTNFLGHTKQEALEKVAQQVAKEVYPPKPVVVPTPPPVAPTPTPTPPAKVKRSDAEVLALREQVHAMRYDKKSLKEIAVATGLSVAGVMYHLKKPRPSPGTVPTTPVEVGKPVPPPVETTPGTPFVQTKTPVELRIATAKADLASGRGFNGKRTMSSRKLESRTVTVALSDEFINMGEAILGPDVTLAQSEAHLGYERAAIAGDALMDAHGRLNRASVAAYGMVKELGFNELVKRKGLQKAVKLRKAFVDEVLAKTKYGSRHGPGDVPSTKALSAGDQEFLRRAAWNMYNVWGPVADSALKRIPSPLLDPSRGRAVNNERMGYMSFYDARTFCHELGHSIETQVTSPGKVRRHVKPARSYWANRVEARGRGHAKAQVGPDKGEDGWADKWGSEYMGKDYGTGHTEVVSMMSEVLGTGHVSVWNDQLKRDSTTIAEFVGYAKAAIDGELTRKGYLPGKVV